MISFTLRFKPEAEGDLEALIDDPSKQAVLKAVRKAFTLMETNLRHPSLNTHEYHGLEGENGEKVFESYAQNNTPGAYRIFWHYGPGRNVITILTIVKHPKY